MTVQYLAGLKVLAQSTDTKPILDKDSWTFEERDTGRIFKWDGTTWVQEGLTQEAKNRAHRQPAESVISLFGDEFARLRATHVYRLEDTSNEQGGDNLANNGSVEFIESDEPGWRGYKVATFDGSNHLSLAGTAGEFGSNGAVVHFEFKCDRSINQALVAYGQATNNQQEWRIGINSTGRVWCTVQNASNEARAISQTRHQFTDNKRHIATMMWLPGDRLELFIDGMSVALDTTNLPTGSINNSGESLRIGARRSTSVGEYFEGEISNVHIYKSTDNEELKRLIPILQSGLLRESAAGANDFLLGTQNTGIFNSSIEFPRIGGATYTHCIINTSGGEYDLTRIYQTEHNRGICTIDIDGVNVYRNDDHSSSAVYNVTDTVRVRLTPGTHLVKIANPERNPASNNHSIEINTISFVKRNGEVNVFESGDFVIFPYMLGRRNNNWSIVVSSGEPFGRRDEHGTSGSYMEGDFAFQEGTYRITLQYMRHSSNGNASLKIGNIDVLDEFDQSGAFTHLKHTVNVHIPKGIHTVRFENSGGGNVGINNIFVQQISGNNTQNVTIWGSDVFENAFGTQNALSSSAYRFAQAYNTGDTDGSHNIREIYLQKGVYEVELEWFKQPNLGILDVGFDGDTDYIFDGLDQHVATGGERLHSKKIINVTESGYHTVHFATAGKNASSTGYNTRFTYCRFSKVGDYQEIESPKTLDNTIPLVRYTARKAEGEKTFNLAGVDGAHFSKINVVVRGKMDTSSTLNMVLNGNEDSGEYSTRGRQRISDTITNTSNTNHSFITVLLADLFTSGGLEFFADVNLYINKSNTNRIYGSSNAVVSGTNSHKTNFTSVTQEAYLGSLKISNAQNWRTEAQIDVYGVRET